ncbi:hypothetical protein B0H14DRAFT_2781945 [Mycena olivaceomarginata]|nr:hypothetical protein B0H14DRAFT_2781945 [Mycena olivaceomarginata]
MSQRSGFFSRVLATGYGWREKRGAGTPCSSMYGCSSSSCVQGSFVPSLTLRRRAHVVRSPLLTNIVQQHRYYLHTPPPASYTYPALPAYPFTPPPFPCPISLHPRLVDLHLPRPPRHHCVLNADAAQDTRARRAWQEQTQEEVPEGASRRRTDARSGDSLSGRGVKHGGGAGGAHALLRAGGERRARAGRRAWRHPECAVGAGGGGVKAGDGVGASSKEVPTADV